jgi:hypothetical protein
VIRFLTATSDQPCEARLWTVTNGSARTVIFPWNHAQASLSGQGEDFGQAPEGIRR